ncbi:MAG TPA: CDP-alcohol phosphatidyltransferase family protein [Natronosporangium sp.]|nr:CDP-alcohol phosphatidyltransferase family protein [Natronosporangium sp.]
MAKIFSGAVRVSGARVVDPIGRALLRLGISPDLVTVLGTLGVVAGAVAFGARGKFLAAALVVAVFAVVDFVDGAMARARGYSTRFGAFLDSTMDRIADGAVLGAVAYWYAGVGETPTLVVTLVCLVASQVISYVKARAQSLGIDCDVGIAERAERLLVIGIGALVTGLGVGWALPAALWLLAVLSVITVIQRIMHVRRADIRAREAGE